MDGQIVREVGIQVDPAAVEIRVGGRLVQPAAKIFLLLHKPRGVLTTCSDPQGRPTVLDLAPKVSTSLFPVGRLDRETEGLLLLTNDGQVALVLTHPRYEVEKVYRVWTARRVTADDLRALRQGVRLADGWARPRRVAQRGSRSVELTLIEGRKREIRRLFEALDCPVERLLRVRMGPLSLGQLASGEWRFLTPDEGNHLTQWVEKRRQEKSNPRPLRPPVERARS